MNARIESKNSEWLVEEVVDSLKKAGFEPEIILYPPSRRSVDAVVSLGIGNIFLKIIYDVKELTRTEVDDLVKAEKAYNASAAVIALRDDNVELEDDVIYFKHSTRIVTPRTLEKSLKGDKPIVASIRGNYVLRINPAKFHTKRVKHGYSRGELARLINVSTKTIYMYEQGEMYVSLEKALRIATILGEDVFEEFDLQHTPVVSGKRPPSCTPRDQIEELIYSVASRYRREFLNFEKTPIDAVVKNGFILSIVKDMHGLRDKIENAEKIVNRVKAELIVIRDEKDVLAIKRVLARDQ